MKGGGVRGRNGIGPYSIWADAVARTMKTDLQAGGRVNDVLHIPWSHILRSGMADSQQTKTADVVSLRIGFLPLLKQSEETICGTLQVFSPAQGEAFQRV